MSTFIGVECLAANALIELYQQGISEIGFKELADYGLLVVDKYETQDGENAVLIFDSEEIMGWVVSYSEYFEIEEREQKYICLKQGVDIKELKQKFRWTLSYSMLRALNQVSVMDAMNWA